MANRGEGKSQKSISSPKVRYFNRKEEVFTPRTRPGPHNSRTSAPLMFVLRNLLAVVNNKRETEKILAEEKVLVNGIPRKSRSFSVGLFDVVELPEMKKKYRALFDSKGRLVLKEIDAKEGTFKISKVVKKRALKGGKIMLTTNDGFNIEAGKEKVDVEDSIKISLPELKMQGVFRLEKGSIVFIIGGTHVGETITVEEVIQGSLQRNKVVSLADNEKKYQTVTRNVFVIGKGKPELEALKSA